MDQVFRVFRVFRGLPPSLLRGNAGQVLRSAAEYPSVQGMRYLWIMLLVGLLGGCGDGEVTVYEVPAEDRDRAEASVGESGSNRVTVAPQVVGADMASSNFQPQTADGGNPSWQAPAAWTALPAGGVRRAAWRLEKANQSAEVTVTAFPGDVGGLLANVNRWRRQIGLGPVGSAAEAGVRHRDVGALHVDTVLIEGQGGQSILASSVPHAGQTWYFKMTGDTALVTSQVESWDAFVGSLAFPESEQ